MNIKTKVHISVMFFYLLLLQACASKIPGPIKSAPIPQVNVADVRNTPDKFQDQTARWGGLIIKTVNKKSHSLIYILGKPLSGSGRPRETETSDGRFVARVKTFLDPEVYSKGREVTLHGTITTSIQEKIGDYLYTYPVLGADVYYLWPTRPEPAEPLYWYDPWYPFYPHHPAYW